MNEPEMLRRAADHIHETFHGVDEHEGFVWLGLKDPSDADLEALADQFDLHPLAVEDAAHGHTRSKLEVFGDTLFVVLSTVAYLDHEELTATSEVVATGQVMVFLGERFVIAYAAVKENEYETFLQVISSWEREHLLLNV